MEPLPPIESLQCFLAASRTLNFRNAAAEVHLSAAALGQRIRQLEEYLGLPLFVRSTRKVQLTDAGRRLIPKVQNVLETVAGLPSLARDDALVIQRNITIGTRHELGLSWLTPLIAPLEKSVPGVTLHLHFGDSEELLRCLHKGEIDAAICSVRLADRRFEFELLHEEHYQMVASTKLVESEGIRTLASLLDQTLIDSNGTLPLARYWLDADKDRSHLQFSKLRFMGTIGAIRDLVRRGEGVAVLPRYFIERDIERGRLQALFPKKKLLTDHFRLLFSRSSRQSEIFSRFAEVMRDSPLR